MDTILLPEGVKAQDLQKTIEENPDISKLVLALDAFGSHASTIEIKYALHKLGMEDEDSRFTFREFIEVAIKPYQPLMGEVYPLHKEWIDLIEDNPEDDIIVFASIDSWKSTIIGADYCLYLMYLTKGKVRICLISETENLSKDRLVQCRNAIENNPILNELGVRKPIPNKVRDWGELSFTIDREDEGIFGSTLAACGIGGTIQGKKYDVIILDDVVSLKNSSTPINRQKIEKKYKREVYTRLLEIPTYPLKRSRVLAVCTSLHKDDLNQKLSEGFEGEEPFICRKYKAIYQLNEYEIAPDFVKKQLDDCIYMVPDGETGTKPIGLAFPERLNYESLMRKKSKGGATAFAQNYLLEPMSDEDYVIKPEWIHKCFDMSKKMGPSLWFNHYMNRGYTLFFVLDPAIKGNKREAEKKDTDYWNIEARCYHPGDDMRVILDFYRNRGIRKQVMLDMIKEFYVSFLYRDPVPHITVAGTNVQKTMPKLFVESNQAQEYLAQDFDDIFGPTNVVRVLTTHVSKNDGFVGLPAVTFAFEKTHVVIPCGDTRSSDYAKELESEAINYGHTWGHDDIMSCQLINEVAVGTIKSRNLITMLDNKDFGMPTRGPRNFRNLPTPRQRYAARRRYS